MKKGFVVTGLGYGDEGKGTITHWLATQHRAHAVIRTGGPQALHRVVCSDGAEHTFSQFGSGTLSGAGTHLSKHMVIDPHAILREGEVLTYEHRIRSAFEAMTIHEDALVITPFQAIAGRVRELMRGKGRYGSVGIGVGETVTDAERFGDAAIRAKHLSRPDLRSRLEEIQRRKWAEFEAFADRISAIPSDVRERVRKELGEMEDSDTVQWAVERFTELVRRVRIVNTDYVAERILGPDGTVIVEGSQGVLLDRFYGFHPYTTKVRTVPGLAHELFAECDYSGSVESIGVLRAYHTRHGAGPFVSESPELTQELPDTANKEHPWQGRFRVGRFDAVAARYALAACGAGLISSVAITCLDRVRTCGPWSVCQEYEIDSRIPHDSGEFFRTEGMRVRDIIVPGGTCDIGQLERQRRLGEMLAWCVAKTSVLQPDAGTFRELLGVPVLVMSQGETEKDKNSRL